jgi:hypothetical protein
MNSELDQRDAAFFFRMRPVVLRLLLLLQLLLQRPT